MSGDRLNVGIVTPHSASGPEVELPAMTGGRVTTVVSRTVSPPDPSRAHHPLRASTEPAALDRAAMAFASDTLDAVAHASTTCGYVIGHREEAALLERLSQRFGVPARASCAAAVAALRAHEIGHVQLVHPPWFDADFDELGTAYFRSQGFQTAVVKAVDLTSDPARTDPMRVVDWVERHVEDRAEAIYLAGNGFRAADAIHQLERRTGRLVLEANQALLWGILTATGTSWSIAGHGRLLRANATTR